MGKLVKVLVFIALASVLTLATMPTLAEDLPESRVVVNMTGVNQTRYIINRSGVGDSRYIISTTIIEIGLHDVTLYPISINFGTLRANDIRQSDSTFTVYNAGAVTVDVTIGVSGDWRGATGNWTHSDECEVGESTAGLRAIVEDGNGHTSIIVKKTAPYNYLVTGLEPDERVSFALEIYAPTTIADYSHKYNGIFIETSEA